MTAATTERVDYEVKDSHGNVLARVIRYGELLRQMEPGGVNFLTRPHEDFQLGLMRHPAGKEVRPHVHNPMSRSIETTTEVLVVLKGRIRLDLYAALDWEIQSEEVGAGDVVMLLGGGHGMTVLEECEVIEARVGPYLGAEIEKRYLK